jgi:hypothetical protein
MMSAERQILTMSCWVVPTLAAEYLGISLDEVQDRLRCGTLTSMHDHGFLFVDVAPDSPVMQLAQAGPTFVELTDEELAALNGEEIIGPVPITSSPEWAGHRESAGQLRRRPAA